MDQLVSEITKILIIGILMKSRYQFILHIIKQVRKLSIEDDCHQMNAVISVRRPWRETEHFSAATVSEITVSFVPLLSE